MNDFLTFLPQRILIIRLSAIGDVVRTLPALRALRTKFPSAYIAWVVEENAREILEGHPDLDRVFIVKRKRWTGGVFQLSSFFSTIDEVRAFIKTIRDDHFDITLDFHGILKSGVISALSGAPVRVGFNPKYCKEGNYLFNTFHIEIGTSALSRIDRNLRFIHFLGINGEYQDPIIPVTDCDRKHINEFFERNALPGHFPLIAIHPGTSNKTLYKRWDLVHYARVADTLIEKLDAKIIWTWGPGEMETVHTIRNAMKHGSTVACSVNLRELAELFRRCHLFLGSDSGPMHIAAFVKTPVVVLYGPTDPLVNAPCTGTKQIVLRKDVSCNPCRNRDCSSLRCMAAITPEEVIAAVDELINKQGKTSF